MRKISLLCLLLLALAPVAWGQVAAPRLGIGLTSFGNPGVLPHAMPSYVGIGYADVAVEFTPVVGNALEVASGSGTSLNVLASNGSFGAAIDVLNIELEADPSFGGGTFKNEELNVGLGVMLGEGFGIGIASETESQDDNGDVRDDSMPYGGISWKLGETFFIGGTYGTRTVEYSNTLNPALTASGEQTVSRIGLGFYSRDNESGFHAEVYRELGELLEVRDDANTLVYAEENEAIGLTLEARFSGFLIGIERVSDTVDQLDPFQVPPLQTVEEEDTTIFLGWAPQEGMGLTLASINSDETDEAGNVVNISGTYVNLNFAF